ncbi:hypothetical protein AURDEDRAFT_150598 [Auricularia subglabra TFB-10046 SS5]|nr:hypothetical protein AURDEDRAFT_150598 [Auricularia subglabra TFB-10046 SS5]
MAYNDLLDRHNALSRDVRIFLDDAHDDQDQYEAAVCLSARVYELRASLSAGELENMDFPQRQSELRQSCDTMLGELRTRMGLRPVSPAQAAPSPEAGIQNLPYNLPDVRRLLLYGVIESLSGRMVGVFLASDDGAELPPNQHLRLQRLFGPRVQIVPLPTSTGYAPYF